MSDEVEALNKSTLSEGHKARIVGAIREKETEDKPALAGLYHHLEILYRASNKFEKADKENVGRVTQSTNSYAHQVVKQIGGNSELDEDLHSERLMEFFSQEESSLIRSGAIIPATCSSYWLDCMKKVDLIRAFIEPADEPILRHLTAIEVQTNEEDNQTETVVFIFSENPYFKNDRLQLVLSFEEDVPDDIEATTIEWRSPDMNPTIKRVKKVQQIKTKKSKKLAAKTQEVEVEERQRSFFRIFKDRSMDDDSSENEDSEEDEDESSSKSSNSADKGFYNFASISNLVELFWESFTKFHGAIYYGVDMTEVFKAYEQEDGYETDSEDEDNDDDEDDEDNDSSDSDKKKKKKKNTESKTKTKSGESPKETKGPSQEECKKQ